MKFGVSTSLFESAYGHFLAGSFDDCELACRQSLDLDPRNADSLHLLGVLAGRAGHPDQAVALFEQALTVSPDFAEAHANRGLALIHLGRIEEAVQSLDRSLELKPDHVQSHYAFGELLARNGDNAGSAGAFMKVLELEPDNVGALNGLGGALHRFGDSYAAVKHLRRATQVEPRMAASWYNLAVVLLLIGEIDEAIEANRKALQLYPGYGLAHANLLMALNYDPKASQADILAESRAFDRLNCAPLAPSHPLFVHARDPERRLRIGYVSGDLRTHPVGYYLPHVIEAHDRQTVEVFLYSNGGKPDAVTERFSAAADQWRDIAGAPDEAVAVRIRQDQIDILVDLTGHTEAGRLPLFARKLAPVQVSWLGYPNTTGVSAIDYLVMDEAMIPSGDEAWCTEAVARLPHGRFCYDPPAYAPAPAAREGQAVVFGSFNALPKLNDTVIRLWARVLNAVPGSRLLLKATRMGEPGMRERIAKAFAEAGVGADRLELRPASPHADMLAEYGEIDIALDPFPFCGGLTSSEALWMGVPVVTLPRDRPEARQTLSFLTELGLADLAAASEDDYVRIAAALATDAGRRTELRGSIRERMRASPMTDSAKFTPGLEAAYRQMWRRFCAGERSAAI